LSKSRSFGGHLLSNIRFLTVRPIAGSDLHVHASGALPPIPKRSTTKADRTWCILSVGRATFSLLDLKIFEFAEFNYCAHAERAKSLSD
jgi:hypothetical protein